MQASRDRVFEHPHLRPTAAHRRILIIDRMNRALRVAQARGVMSPILAQASNNLQVYLASRVYEGAGQTASPALVHHATDEMPANVLSQQEKDAMDHKLDDLLLYVQGAAQRERGVAEWTQAGQRACSPRSPSPERERRGGSPRRRSTPRPQDTRRRRAPRVPCRLPRPQAERRLRVIGRFLEQQRAPARAQQTRQTHTNARSGSPQPEAPKRSRIPVRGFVKWVTTLMLLAGKQTGEIANGVSKLCKYGLELMVRGVKSTLLTPEYTLLFHKLKTIQASRMFKSLLVAGAAGVLYAKWSDIFSGLLTTPGTVRRAVEQHEKRTSPIYESTGTATPEPTPLFDAAAEEAISTLAESNPDMPGLSALLSPTGLSLSNLDRLALAKQLSRTGSRDKYVSTQAVRDHLVSVLLAIQPLKREHTEELLKRGPCLKVPQQVGRDIEEYDWETWPKTRAFLEPARLALQKHWDLVRDQRREMDTSTAAQILLDLRPSTSHWVWNLIDARSSGTVRDETAIMQECMAPKILNVIQTLPSWAARILLMMAYHHQSLLVFTDPQS